MNTNKATIFIDSQLYIDLYRLSSGKELLAPLNEQKDYIFITEQIVNEVNRHKLHEAIDLFKKCQIVGGTNCTLPDHLFDDSGAAVKSIRKKLKNAKANIDEAIEELNSAIIQTLRDISRSDDVVSKALAPLFAKAITHKPEEWERAKVRKARGVPPGKTRDSVGDELNWEQFIGFVKTHKKTKVWILSRDSDYTQQWAKGALLNPTLYSELRALSNPPPEVHVFRTIPEGLKNFAEVTGARAEKLPSAEKIEEIRKEQESLPNVDWMPFYSTGDRAPNSYNIYSALNNASMGTGMLLPGDVIFTAVNNPGTSNFCGWNCSKLNTRAQQPRPKEAEVRFIHIVVMTRGLLRVFDLSGYASRQFKAMPDFFGSEKPNARRFRIWTVWSPARERWTRLAVTEPKVTESL